MVLLFIGFSEINAQEEKLFFDEANVFLKTYVSNGKVDYKSISKSPSGLDNLLKMASTIKIDKSDKKSYQAFWINAYNLAVIKGVIANYPIKSPLDKAGFFDKVKYQLGGKSITLNDIEHKMLRAVFKDPRFHFVLVCGAIGCPPLINEAYLPAKLEHQLQEQTVIAINGNFIKVNTDKKRVSGSEILKWYKEDFTMNGTTEIDFINLYRKEKLTKDYKLSYFPYNWKLNKK